MTAPAVVTRLPRPAAPHGTPVRKRNRRGLRPWVLFVAIVIAAFFGLTYSRISLDRSAFVLDTLEEQIAVQESRHFDLRLEVAELRDPGRIAAEAAELGLVFPTSRVELAVEPIAEPEQLDPDHRWAQLKALLSASP
jgi:cell division protein FtsL